jgi:hypothetical protein
VAENVHPAGFFSKYRESLKIGDPKRTVDGVSHEF